jgi:heme/copper-type cytochrome/quinol oxidase subunit 4
MAAMVSGFVGWNTFAILAGVAVLALVVWGIYWVARLGARRGVLDREAKRD